jgi:hypothetical protein
VAAYLVGSLAAGSALGGALGALGSLLAPSGRVALALLGAAVVAGLALDVLGGARLPTVRRQVNEEWLYRYRGWVYGVGFGFQLGLGVATIVTTSAVYATLLGALLSGSPFLGALLAGTFALGRAVVLLAAFPVTTPGRLVAIDALLRRWDRRSRLASLAAQLGLAAVSLALAFAP